MAIALAISIVDSSFRFSLISAVLEEHESLVGSVGIADVDGTPQGVRWVQFPFSSATFFSARFERA